MIRCTLENNKPGFLRHVTVDALLINENRICLVKRSPTAHLEAGQYALPGGYLERDETTREGIIREVKEETGYDAEVVGLFRVIDNPHRKGEDRQSVDFVYILKPKLKTSAHDDEVDAVLWFDLEKLPPNDQIAFDHAETINLYLGYRKNLTDLPLLS